LTENLGLLGAPGVSVSTELLFFLDGLDADLDREQVELVADRCLSEPLIHEATILGPGGAPSCGDATGRVRVEVALRPGVTDRVAVQLARSAASLGVHLTAATGRAHVLTGTENVDSAVLERLVASVLANPVIETWSRGAVTPGFAPREAVGAPTVSRHVPVRNLDEAALVDLSARRGLSLGDFEMVVVRDWFTEQGRDPTEAELETIAQTWSEHCSHKTFRAPIATPTGRIEPLLEQLRRTTREMAAPHVVSAFDGNAGIVAFPDVGQLAVKVETHNHPSAIEPFGGANTGVGGVVRDVLAAPARPVALTDVLCFAPAEIPAERIPVGTLHPAVITEGVVAGIADYGNKIGVPTVAGAVLFDADFVGNPLVFCGCIGAVMEGRAAMSEPRPGDAIVLIGGATGRDGLKGATFSSMTMDATTGHVAGASVQIGDPITERLVMEALVEMCDRPDPLVRALTDCGAGGLSSAVGEMAEHVGATVRLESVPLKYPGLEPWEVWLSEAQERMVLAVDPDDCPEVAAICERLGVEASIIGEFGGQGRLSVLHHDSVIVDLPGSFLHDARPTRILDAVIADRSMPPGSRSVSDHEATVLALLSHPDIASKEAIIRRYDHEVGGATVVGPMSAPLQSGPSDGAVVADPASRGGFAVAVGVSPAYGRVDAHAMAWAAVDEAIRNVVVAGADPASVALLDNFSWGDPRRPETLGDLVEAVRGCCEASVAHGAPFVSGKDSLNNEYEGPDGRRLAVPPTLVITALAHVPDADAVPSSGLTAPGHLLVLLGGTRDELRGSHLDAVCGRDSGGSLPAPDHDAPARYRAVHRAIRAGLVRAAHDPSEGGLAVALAEMCLSGGLGLDADLSDVHEDATVALYSESSGRILVEVRPADLDGFVATITGSSGEVPLVIGEVRASPGLDITARGTRISISDHEMREAWGRLR
jgi:phosphoribosylformylglycinamidine synthase